MGTEVQPTSPDIQKPLDISDVTEVAKVETDLRALTTQLEAGALHEATGVKETYLLALRIANGELPEDATAEARAERARLQTALDQFNQVLRALRIDPAISGAEPVVVRDGKYVYASDAGPETPQKNRLTEGDWDQPVVPSDVDGENEVIAALRRNGPLTEEDRQNFLALINKGSSGTVDQNAITPVLPREATAQVALEGGMDDEDDMTARATEVETAAVTEAEAVTDPNAERNAASTAIIDKLSKGNFSVGGSIDKGRMDAIREAIVGHMGEELAARFDTDGNIVIGVPQTEGSYLRSRVITIDAKQDAGIVDWIKQSLSKETVLLRETQYTVPVEKNPVTTV